jgi:hypothetical protein
MDTTRQITLRKSWNDFGSRADGSEEIRPDGLIDAPEFLVRIIGRQNAELRELLSAPKTARSRRA